MRIHSSCNKAVPESFSALLAESTCHRWPCATPQGLIAVELIALELMAVKLMALELMAVKLMAVELMAVELIAEESILFELHVTQSIS